MWLPSVTSFPDDGCFDEQLQHKCCLTSRFVRFRVLILSLVLSRRKFIWKAVLGKLSCFTHLKQFPFAGSVSGACILLTLLPACMRRVCANTSSLSVPWFSKGLPGLTKFASTFSVGFRIWKECQISFLPFFCLKHCNCNLKCLIYCHRHLKYNPLSRVSRQSGCKSLQKHPLSLVITKFLNQGVLYFRGCFS